jgi:hypothetical protein
MAACCTRVEPDSEEGAGSIVDPLVDAGKGSGHRRLRRVHRNEHTETVDHRGCATWEDPRRSLVEVEPGRPIGSLCGTATSDLFCLRAVVQRCRIGCAPTASTDPVTDHPGGREPEGQLSRPDNLLERSQRPRSSCRRWTGCLLGSPARSAHERNGAQRGCHQSVESRRPTSLPLPR